MENCTFCKIIADEIPSEKVFENAEITAFKDLNPQAKTHILITPRKHIATIVDLKVAEADDRLVGDMVIVARDLAKEMGISGYKLQFNVGESGGQIVYHIHLHLTSND